MTQLPADNAKFEFNFVIESSDLFPVNLKLSRIRIILGLAVSLTLVGALVWFFLILGETKILLQTSPLFVGMPLLAVGGQILRLHAFCRKYVRGLPANQRRMRYCFSSADNSFQVTSGESVSNISWNDVMKVTEDRKRFLFFYNKFEVSIIPKRAFTQPDSIARLRQLALTKLGERASVLR